MSQYLYRVDDNERYTRGIDGLYTQDRSMMAVPWKYTYARLMDTGAFSSLPIEKRKVDMTSLVTTVFATSEDIKNGRVPMTVLPFVMEEVGELALEVAIDFGISAKPEGDDGVIGEAIDSIICLLDLIKLHKPDITEYELVEVANRKCSKWRAKG